MRKTSTFLTVALATVSTLAVGSACAATLVSTISGGYDENVYDTPQLNINNPTAFDFKNVTLVLQGYQADNNTETQTITLGTVAAGTTDIVDWGETPSEGTLGVGPLTQNSGEGQPLWDYDYDDQYGQQTTNALCVQPFPLCSFVGNFKVTFTATWENPAYNGGAGTEISSVFTPSANATGGFVGWEGLNADGLSETVYDEHHGSFTGDLANIYVGPPTTGVPGASYLGIDAWRRWRSRVRLPAPGPRRECRSNRCSNAPSRGERNASPRASFHCVGSRLGMSETPATNYANIFGSPLMAHRWADAEALNAALRAAIAQHEGADSGEAKTNVGGWHSASGQLEFCGEAGQTLIAHMREMADEATARVFKESHGHPRGRWNGPCTLG